MNHDAILHFLAPTAARAEQAERISKLTQYIHYAIMSIPGTSCSSHAQLPRAASGHCVGQV